MKIGIISDTHGLLRPQALVALEGCTQILHSGDIGKPSILESLAAIAPLHVVRGNNDMSADWAANLPLCLELNVHSMGIYMTHEFADLPSPLPARIRVVVTGHSHKPSIHQRDGVLFINPGSAGPPRFQLPISLALLHIEGENLRAELIELPV